MSWHNYKNKRHRQRFCNNNNNNNNNINHNNATFPDNLKNKTERKRDPSFLPSFYVTSQISRERN